MLAAKPKTGRVLLAVTLATLVIFGGLVAGITWRSRQAVRTEILRREAESIAAVAHLQLRTAEARAAEFGEDGAFDDLFAAVLESSRYRGVLAVQLFDRGGTLRAALPTPAGEPPATWWSGQLAEPRARFAPRGSIEAIFGLPSEAPGDATRAPLLDVVVPLASATAGDDVIGVARYWIDGAAVAAEFARMDRRLLGQATLAFTGAALLVGGVLAWAFRTLAAAQRQLVEQSADLARANAELDFAAKTAALGAITAHLIHGLRSPLAGLEGYVADTANGAGDAIDGEAGRAAIETTRRLRTLVNEVASVLRDEADGGGADAPVPLRDVVSGIRMRALPAAERAGVSVVVDVPEPAAAVSLRTANLTGLILANLIANAIEASPRGATVTLAVRATDERIEFTVGDAGPGLPEAVRAELFRPVRSSKRGGGGVGLAISQRLARHAGGTLELAETSPRGTTFRLAVPRVPV